MATPDNPEQKEKTTVKVFDSINPREGIEIGEAETPEAAMAMLRKHYAGTGEDRLCGVTTTDYGADWRGEVYVPRLAGINT